MKKFMPVKLEASDGDIKSVKGHLVDPELTDLGSTNKPAAKEKVKQQEELIEALASTSSYLMTEIRSLLRNVNLAVILFTYGRIDSKKIGNPCAEGV